MALDKNKQTNTNLARLLKNLVIRETGLKIDIIRTIVTVVSIHTEKSEVT